MEAAKEHSSGAYDKSTETSLVESSEQVETVKDDDSGKTAVADDGDTYSITDVVYL